MAIILDDYPSPWLSCRLPAADAADSGPRGLQSDFESSVERASMAARAPVHFVSPLTCSVPSPSDAMSSPREGEKVRKERGRESERERERQENVTLTIS